jgi:hypothetical protein
VTQELRPDRNVYRLRDLGPRGRLLAAAFALALTLAPALAFAWATPDWAPAGDPAFMGIRALDVGTTRTPLTGQPSTASQYLQRAGHVNHPGPTHFYLLAPAIRLFGGDVGMPLVTLAVVEASVVIGAWAVFRQLGPAAGALAAVLLGAVMFTTGASSLIDPVSSSIAGYPLLCASILCWCVLCGDLRLLPLATGVVSFTAQQHLSVAPAILVVAASALVGLVVARLRRRPVGRALAWSAAVAFVLWAPVLLQQVASPDGNLGRLVSYTRSSDRDTLGMTSALHQLVHVLGLPPLLFETRLSGWKLLADPPAGTWASAAAVTAVVAALGVRWRRRAPRQASLAVMVGVLVVAGLLNGSSVPVGLLEQGRIAFYHWVFVLAFFVALVVGLGLLALLHRPRRARPALAPALAVLGLAAIVVPAAVNPSLDRPTNALASAHSYLASRHVHRLGDAVLDHRRALGDQTVLFTRGGQLYSGLREALAFELTERGVDVRHPLTQRGFVDADRLVDPATVDSGLVLVSEGPRPERGPGRLLAEVRPFPHLDLAAYRALIAQAARARRVRIGPEAEAGLASIDDGGRAFIIWAAINQLPKAPARVLVPDVLQFLLDHPVVEPRLDPALIRRVLDSAPPTWAPDVAFGLRLYLMDRAEVRRFALPQEL